MILPVGDFDENLQERLVRLEPRLVRGDIDDRAGGNGGNRPTEVGDGLHRVEQRQPHLTEYTERQLQQFDLVRRVAGEIVGTTRPGDLVRHRPVVPRRLIHEAAEGLAHLVTEIRHAGRAVGRPHHDDTDDVVGRDESIGITVAEFHRHAIENFAADAVSEQRELGLLTALGLVLVHQPIGRRDAVGDRLLVGRHVVEYVEAVGGGIRDVEPADGAGAVRVRLTDRNGDVADPVRRDRLRFFVERIAIGVRVGGSGHRQQQYVRAVLRVVVRIDIRALRRTEVGRTRLCRTRIGRSRVGRGQRSSGSCKGQRHCDNRRSNQYGTERRCQNTLTTQHFCRDLPSLTRQQP